jgi:hypothetical protein
MSNNETNRDECVAQMAWLDTSTNLILVRKPGSDWCLSFHSDKVERLKTRLTAAIEKAMRQGDPFERWLESLDRTWEQGEKRYLIAAGVWARKEGARKIWDAVQAAAKEGR